MRDAFDDTVLRLRIIVAALVFGVATFGAIAYFLVHGNGFTTDSSLRMPLIGALGALIMILLLVYPVIEKNLVKKAEEIHMGGEVILPAYSMLVVIRSAMIESIGLFGGIIYLLTAHFLGLVAIVCSIALLLARLPSRREAREFAARVEGAT